jgi:chromosome segregation ATPase
VANTIINQSGVGIAMTAEQMLDMIQAQKMQKPLDYSQYVQNGAMLGAITVPQSKASQTGSFQQNISAVDILEARVERLNKEITDIDADVRRLQTQIDEKLPLKAELERQRVNLQAAIDLLENELVEE